MSAKTLTKFGALTFCAAACYAQAYFCPAGVTANGFVDWSKLPAPPAPMAAFSQTIPVSGVSGLNITISSPAAAGFSLFSYKVIDPTKLQIGVSGSSRDVTLTFSKPVRGLRMVAETLGRFPQSFNLKAIRTNGSPTIPDFGTASSQFNSSPSQDTLTPLQIRDDSGDIQSVILSFTGDDEEYQYLAIDNLRIDSGTEADPASQVPKQGLSQWFRADKGIISDGYPTVHVLGWADQSGAGAGAVQDSPAEEPILVPQDGAHCQPSISFNGSSFLKAHLPIEGWTQMTVFLVAKASNDVSDGPYHSFHPALYWEETGPWGKTYVSPFQTHLAYRFGTGQAFNDPEVIRSSNVGGDFTLTTAVHDQTTDSVFVNGSLVSKITGRQTTFMHNSDEEFLGLGSQSTFFTGEISELLIYHRTLTDTERHTVESYLMNKYGPF